MPVRIALPKGRLLTETAALLKKAGWQLSDYDTSLRNYRLSSGRFPELLIKVFQEKDIPIQVAIGNYDLGICGLDWIEELSTKYTNTALMKVKNLGYGNGALYIAGNRTQIGLSIDALRAQDEIIRIASEYPNLAESVALKNRPCARRQILHAIPVEVAHSERVRPTRNTDADRRGEGNGP